MLVARRGGSLSFVGRFHPVPAAIAMAAQAPRIGQTALIGGATTETDHHTRGTASLAKGRRVVDSGRRLLLAAVKLVPGERRPFHAEAPHVVDGLLSGISAKHE